MRSLRDWLGSSGRLLAQRLEQLSESLEGMADRLREAIAHAVGTALGSVIRDTLRHVLDNLTDARPAPRTPPPWPRRYAPEPEMALGDADPRTDSEDFWPEDIEARHEPAVRASQPVTRSPGQRVAVSVAAGLQAAWACKRSLVQPGVLAIVGVGLLAGGAAYAAPALATAALVLAGSAGPLGLLAAALHSLGLS